MSQVPSFTGRRHAPLAAGDVALRVFMDSASVEIFADGGAVCITEQLFPRGEIKTLALFAQSGSVSMSDMQLWPLAPAPITDHSMPEA